MCQNQEWGPYTANAIISNEETFLQGCADSSLISMGLSNNFGVNSFDHNLVL